MHSRCCGSFVIEICLEMCFIQHPKKEEKLVCTCAYSGDTLNLFVALVSFRHPANLSGRNCSFLFTAGAHGRAVFTYTQVISG